MKKVRTILFLSVLFVVQAFAWPALEDGIALIKSQRGVVLVFNEGGLHFTIELPGQEIRPADTNRIFLSIDGRMVQVQTAHVKEFQQPGQKQKPTEAELLSQHRDWEQDYLSNLLKAKLKVTSERVTTKTNREALLWHFPMPEGMNQQVMTQVFLTTVMGEHLLVLNYSVEKDDTVNNAQKYLTEVLSSLKTSPTPIAVKTVQAELVGAPATPQDQPRSASTQEEIRKIEEAIKPYIEQAKQTFPEAKKRFLAGLPPRHTFYITTQLRDAEGRVEQVFIAVKRIENDMIYGFIANDINVVSGYKRGDAYKFSETALRDWTITRPDGSEEGNFVGKFLDTYQKPK